MKIKYESVTGEITEVEVSEEIGAVIIDSRKAEHAQNERHRYHCYSYDAIEFEGLEYADKDTAETTLLTKELSIALNKGIASLTPTQRRRFELFASGISYRKIAEMENVSHTKIMKSIDQARKKLKKFF